MPFKKLPKIQFYISIKKLIDPDQPCVIKRAVKIDTLPMYTANILSSFLT